VLLKIKNIQKNIYFNIFLNKKYLKKKKQELQARTS
jgi:hypothetical protein